MKDKRNFICLILLISSVLFSCKWQIPEKVSVKTKADYSFSAGNINMSLDEQLDIKKIMENGGALPASVKVYDYFPGEKDPNTQRYLIKVALAEIPLDLDSMMAQIDLTSNLKAMEFNKEIAVPKIDIPAISQAFTIPNSEFLNGSTALPPVSFDLAPITLKEILPVSSGVKECVIKDGKLDVKIEGLNEDANYTVNLVSTGGLIVPNGAGGRPEGIEVPITLGDATIKSGEESNITVKITLTNVKTVNNPKFSIAPVINSIKSLTVDLGEGIPTSFAKTQPLPEEAKSVVGSIQLNNSGFDIEYTNTLPATNKIAFSTESNFLGITPAKEVEFKNGTDKFSVNSSALVDSVKLNAGVDFKVGLTLPGAVPNAAGDKTTSITISDVVMGETYKLGFKITPKLDWTTVTVKPSALSNMSSIQGDVDLQLDLNKMLSELGTKLAGDPTLFTNITFGQTPVYIFCSKPEGIAAFNNLKFEGTASLKVGTENIGDLLKSGDTLSPVGVLPKVGDFVVVEDLANANASTPTPIELGNIINNAIKKPGNLNINYNVGITGGSGQDITINKADLKGVAKIAIETYIDLGLALTLPPAGIPVDLSKMEGIKDMVGKDIFQGNGKSMKDQGYDAYMKAIKELSIKSSVKSLPYASDKPITLDMTSSVGDWNFELGQGKDFIVKLTNDNICKLFDETANPGCEFKIKTMKVQIPGGTFSIPRAKAVNTNLELNLKTDGTIKVWEKGQNPKGSNSNPSSNGGN